MLLWLTPLQTGSCPTFEARFSLHELTYTVYVRQAVLVDRNCCFAVLGASVASPAKPSFNALHLPMSRVLLITVVFALMGVPLLFFMAGRLQVSMASAAEGGEDKKTDKTHRPGCRRGHSTCVQEATSEWDVPR